MKVLWDHVCVSTLKRQSRYGKNNAHLNFLFLFVFINGIIDDENYVPRKVSYRSMGTLPIDWPTGLWVGHP